jgi:2-polyprenyl-3-methyl-5-hydroxy-6-metoxy-1,4-benzoquinol methylase
MTDLHQRSKEIEIMDDLECSGEMLDQALRELEFINKWLGGNAVTLNAISKLLEHHTKEQTYSIADLGCGGGDMALLIKTWAEKNNYTTEITGIDANPNAIEYARRRVGQGSLAFHAMNIFSDEFKKLKFDIVIGTLFFHHFTKDELIGFFRQLKEQVRVGFVINDIHRHPFALHSIGILTRLFSKSAMVRNDAPLSVRRAFLKKELTDILLQAGYTDFSIKWKWAFRWQVIVRTG